MMKFYLYAVLFTALSTLGSYAQEMETISYQTIPQLVLNDEIDAVEIYDFGGNDIDAVFTKKDGSTVAVKRPLGLDQDAVLQQYLTDNRIQYTVYDYEFQGSAKKRPFGGPSTLFMILPMVLMFGIPVLLILVIIRQSKTIAKQAETIKSLIDKEAA